MIRSRDGTDRDTSSAQAGIEYSKGSEDSFFWSDARGNLLQLFTNGVLMSEVRDEDPEKRSAKGLLGVQVHTGPAMKIEFRKIRLKQHDVAVTSPPAE